MRWGVLFFLVLFSVNSLKAIDCAYEKSVDTYTARDLTTAPVLKAAARHLKTLREGDILTAYLKMTTKEFRESTSLQDFIKMVKSLPQLSAFEGISLTGVSFETFAAVWQGNLHDAFGLPTLTVNYAIIKEDGLWRINTMQAGPYAKPQETCAVERKYTPRQSRKHFRHG